MTTATMANHPNRGGNRFNNTAANPTPAQIREQLERFMKLNGKSQAEYGALVYKSVRTVEDWLSGQRRMPPDTYELLEVKIRTGELLKRGRIAPQAVKDLGLVGVPTED